MRPIALLSWRVIAEIAMSNNSSWLKWLVDQQRTNGVLLSYFSLLKASGYIQKHLSHTPISPGGLLERFKLRYLAPQGVVGAGNISWSLYNQLAERLQKEDLELIAICTALQNGYDYICWNEEELNLVHDLAPNLVIKTFAASLDDIRSS